MTSRPAISSGQKTFCASIALGAVLLSPTISSAESLATAEWNISADKITRYEDDDSIVAEGNIILQKRVFLPPKIPQSQERKTDWSNLLGETPEKKDISAGVIDDLNKKSGLKKTVVTIRAEKIVYKIGEQSIEAQGNIRIEGQEDTLVADQGQVNLKEETGSFTNAIITREKDQLHFEGQKIEKTGFNTYRVQDGWVITCKVEEGETPPWHFASADTKIKEGGYAVLKNATFNIKGVPVFYTPYMIVPVKNTRQSGFLFPETASSDNGGVSLNVPYFWNISNSMDMTFFPEIYEKRGFMPGVEFRYVRSTDDRGAFMASYLNDSLSGNDQTTDYYTDTDFTHTNSDRYWIRGKANHDFDHNIIARLDLDIVSDRDYLTEFNSGYTGFENSEDRFKDGFGRGFENKTDDTRENTLKFLKSWEGIALQADFLGINDTRTDEDEGSEDYPLWKLPDITFTGVLPIANSGISFVWDSQYVNYWREDGVGAQRVDIHPGLSASIPLSRYLESRAEIGIRNTYYAIHEYGESNWSGDDTENRLTADFELEIGSTLARNYSVSIENYTGLSHQVRPYIRYNYVPDSDVDPEDLPQFDEVDELDKENSITYGVDNFFDLLSNNSTGREFGWLKISQSYDIEDEEDENRPFSDVLFRLGMTPLENLQFEYETELNVYGDGFTSHSFEGRYSNSRGDHIALDYSYDDEEDIEQINVSGKTKLATRWSLTADIEHSLSESETIEANIGLQYRADCWSVQIQSEYTPTDTKYLLVFTLANIGSPLGFDF